MTMLDLTNPLTLLLITLATALLIFLGQEIKRSAIGIIPLMCFLVSLVVHVVQVSTLAGENISVASTLYKSIAIDFIFILITFFSYLWIDDLEAKRSNRKSIDNSLDWFWKEI